MSGSVQRYLGNDSACVRAQAEQLVQALLQYGICKQTLQAQSALLSLSCMTLLLGEINNELIKCSCLGLQTTEETAPVAVTFHSHVHKYNLIQIYFSHFHKLIIQIKSINSI